MHLVRLSVDARDLTSDTRGIGRYTRAILRRLAKLGQFELSLLLRGPFVSLHRRNLVRALDGARFRVSGCVRNRDIVWHPANGTFFPGGVSVVTMHDAVPFRFPDPDRRRRDHQQAPFVRSVRSAKRIIVPSQFAKQELMDVFSIPAESIEVIYHGVDPFFCPPTRGEDIVPTRVPTPYLLFVGDPLAERRKNFEMLYAAFRKAFPEGSMHLAVAGPSNPRLPGVHYAGLANGDATGVGDLRLRALYREARAVCVPSYYETFGMPMIEAMACGTPVIASEASCLPEIAGDAALYAPAHDTERWSAALSRIAGDDALHEQLRRAGLLHAKTYDWDESARRHAQVFLAL